MIAAYQASRPYKYCASDLFRLIVSTSFIHTHA
jgi:hypothetical protein